MDRASCGSGIGRLVALMVALLTFGCSGKGSNDATSQVDTRQEELSDRSAQPDTWPPTPDTWPPTPDTWPPTPDLSDLPPTPDLSDLPPTPDTWPPTPDASDVPDTVPPCEFAPFPTDCSQVSEFQCGFMAWCEEGLLFVDWHHHYFCNDEESIIDYSCSYACPHGCPQGEIMDWPPDGLSLVDQFCNQCTFPADCEGLAHDACEGNWTCQQGLCVWECGPGCVPEGESAPVVPGAPECCKGLTKIPCDKPDENGACQGCKGATICAACGDGVCGLGENVCNCPKDCQGDCLTLGQGFIDFDTEGKCCPGLTPKFDCDLQPDGCLCKKCPCNICLPCGDGICGPFEHQCNCPEDCPDLDKCVPTTQSECLGEMPEPIPGELQVTIVGNDVHLLHHKVVLNCCGKTEICFEPLVDVIAVKEKLVQPFAPCFCNCVFDIEATLPGIKSGTYKLTLFSEELGKNLFTQDITIP